MKRTVLLITTAFCLLFTGCNNMGTTLTNKENSQYEKYQFGEQYEKKPVRMFNVDGELYFDSGLISENIPRCGTMDGTLKKTVKENEIPLNPGESNFDAEGYQHATSITKEVCIDGKWIIFKKYDTHGRTLDELKYCYYIKGHLNNAYANSEIIVLSKNEDVTFNDVYEPYLSSQFAAGSDIGKTIHNSINNDKWGISLYADNVTPTGLTLKIEQFGGSPTGELHTGSWFKLEKTVNDKWQDVATNPLIDFAWNDIAYIIKERDITELEIEWEWLYGKLEPAFYRISKEVQDFRAPGDFDKEIYQVSFTIE